MLVEIYQKPEELVTNSLFQHFGVFSLEERYPDAQSFILSLWLLSCRKGFFYDSTSSVMLIVYIQILVCIGG